MDLSNAGKPRQFLSVYAREILGIRCHDFQEIIRFTRHQMTLQDVGNTHDLLLESIEHFIGLTGKRDFDENHRCPTQFSRIEQGDIVADEPGTLQTLNTPMTGRRREVHCFRQIGVRNAALALKDREYSGIRRVNVIQGANSMCVMRTWRKIIRNAIGLASANAAHLRGNRSIAWVMEEETP